MQAVAQAVGVRGPSLYKRVRDRSEVMRLIANDVLRELGGRLDSAAQTGVAERCHRGHGARVPRLRPRQPPGVCAAVFASA